MTALAWVGFAVAAAVGAVARYVTDRVVQSRTTSAFPWGTLAVNVSGCLALGVVVGLGRAHGLHPTTLTVVGTGGLGAFTTFSTFAYETVGLVEEGGLALGVRNVGSTVVLGAVAAAAGLALTGAL